jgi:hypothetical protein
VFPGKGKVSLDVDNEIRLMMSFVSKAPAGWNDEVGSIDSSFSAETSSSSSVSNCQ